MVAVVAHGEDFALRDDDVVTGDVGREVLGPELSGAGRGALRGEVVAVWAVVG